MNQDPEQLEPVLAQLFVFAYTWALGGNLTHPCQTPFSSFMHNQFAKLVTLPSTGTVFDFFVDFKKVKGGVGGGAGVPEMRAWASTVPSFTLNKSMPFFQMLVPTVDTVRFSFLLEVRFGAVIYCFSVSTVLWAAHSCCSTAKIANQSSISCSYALHLQWSTRCLVQMLHNKLDVACLQACLSVQKAVLFTGTSGVGKSVILSDALGRLRSARKLVPFTINFSAQTQAIDTQVCLKSCCAAAAAL